jgi:hypothetical protein
VHRLLLLLFKALAPCGLWTRWQAQSASCPAAPKLADLYQLSFCDVIEAN